MYRRSAFALVLSTSLLAGAASAVTLPSDLMMPEPGRAARGYVESWVFSIELEADELKGMDVCRKILTEHGMMPTLSKTGTSEWPALHFKVSGHKEYAQASTEADDMLKAVRQAKCPGTLTWNVTNKQTWSDKSSAEPDVR